MSGEVRPPLHLHLPPSQGHTVRVSMINGALSWLPAPLLVSNPIKGHDKIYLSDYAFLIESSLNGQKILFDLAMMKDVNTHMPPALKKIFENGPGEAKVSADISEQLTEHGTPLSSIISIIWSHSHIDHVGDPSLFPLSVDLIIGPGTPRPGYPSNPDAFLLDSAFNGREVRELDFSSTGLEIGGFRAIDYFDNGSFYLLSAPGHCVGHLMGLARTLSLPESDEWILMAGDSCHHVGQLRPNIYMPFPDSLQYAKFKALLPKGIEESFYGLPEHLHDDIEQAKATVAKVQAFDADERVFVVLAHDRSLLGSVNLHPEALNGWRQRGWGAEEAKWTFLEENFGDALKLVQN